MNSQFSFQPEWHPHRALWVGWPHLPEEWQGKMAAAQNEIAAFVRAASTFVPMRLAIGSDAADASARAAGLAVIADLIRVPTGDIWLRDTGPIFGKGADGHLIARAFGFNGWGEKFDMPGDRQTAAAIGNYEAETLLSSDFVLEGGAIDVDGEGRLLTTRECLLNANRNGKLTEPQAEEFLQATLGVTEIIWLENGLLNDHTDGHIDNIARFVAPGHVVCQHSSSADDPHKDRLAQIEGTLRASGLKVSTIPSPAPVWDSDGEVVPASHMNFLMTNGAVLVPIFDRQTSEEACRNLSALFPDRKIIPLSAHAILTGGGGAFHCMTKDVPA